MWGVRKLSDPVDSGNKSPSLVNKIREQWGKMLSRENSNGEKESRHKGRPAEGRGGEVAEATSYDDVIEVTS